MCFRWTLGSHPAKLFLVPVALQLQSNPFQGELKDHSSIAPPHSANANAIRVCCVQCCSKACSACTNVRGMLLILHSLAKFWRHSIMLPLSCKSLKYAIPTAVLAVFTMAPVSEPSCQQQWETKSRYILCRFVDRFNRLLDHTTSSEKPVQVGLCHPLVPLPLFKLYSCTHPVSRRSV